MPALMIGRLPYRAMKGEVDLDAGPVKAALAGAYDLQDSHDRWSHFAEATVTGGLYPQGGVPVQNFSMEFQPDPFGVASGRVVLLGDDVQFRTLSSEVVRGVMFYLDDGNTKPLIAYHRFQQARTITTAPLTYYLTDRLIAQFDY